MRQGLIIRNAVESDRRFVLANVPRLSAFGQRAWREREAMLATDLAVIERALTSQAPNTVVMVAESAEGVPLGFIHVTSAKDYYTRAEQAHIADLVVAKEGEGQGVGAALMQAGEAWARTRGFRLLTLNVFVENTRAQKLYDRLGFEQDTLQYIKPL